jgi:RNA polymerase sigma factor (sigma-70 family)
MGGFDKRRDRMTEQEIMGMCERLAYRYNSERHREDLKMEGILVCYEILANEPDVHPAKLYREAKRRMHDYLNLDTQPVAIPKHNIARRLTRDIDDRESGNMSEGSRDWLKLVLSSEDRPYDEDFSLSERGHVEEYEKKEYGDHVRSVALEVLSPTELCIIRLRYYEDMTQDEAGVVLGTNKMWVSRHEKEALKGLERALL